MAELASQPTSVQTVYGWYRDNKLLVNRRYQRKLVWTREEKQKLIESLLKKYPVPAILLAERDGQPGTYEIIDGLQRLHSVVSFIENSFSLSDGRYFDVSQFLTANNAASEGAFTIENGPFVLPKEASTILDYTLGLSIMRNATNDEVNDVFDRINTYGHRLSDQERRQSGVQNEFSTMIRSLACAFRGDVSEDILALKSMPSISVDAPSSNHGYDVKAEEVFWVQHGILKSTDLRDSLDEQCLADIAACIIGPNLIERSKDALDEIYIKNSPESEATLAALEVYGSNKIVDEIKFCVEELLKICSTDSASKLRSIVFPKTNTNAFPSVFAVILIAMHELIVKEKKKISNYSESKAALNDISTRLAIGKAATSADERRKNIDTVKGLISGSFVKANIDKQIYTDHTSIDIEGIIRRSEIELASYELKQGILLLKDKNSGEDQEAINKIINTISAIANNGPATSGKILIGVTDKKSDADRISGIDKIEAKKVGKRYVVGVNREAKRLKLSVEQYFARWKDIIKKSALTDKLKDSVLSNIDFNSFYGLGVIVITIPSQTELSYVGEELFWRNGDATEAAKTAKQIASIASRFAKH